MAGGRPLRIGVVGSGSPDAPGMEAAERAGRALGRAGAVVVCGGLGGVMEAAARGASTAGGQVLGFLPGEDASAAAPGVTIPIPTGMGEARNVLVVRASEAVLALAGSWGTWSEAAFCMKLDVPLFAVGEALPEPFPARSFPDPEEAAERALRAARDRRARGPAAGAEGGGR